MHNVYDRWPEIAKEFYNMEYDVVDLKDIDHIVFVGMGGSGALGDTLSSILSKTDMHIQVVKGYHLPKTVDSNTVIVASSASGNTLETLTVLAAAKKTECRIIAFSSGGKMERYCTKNAIEYRKVPILNSPRASFPAYLYAMLSVLRPILNVEKKVVMKSIASLENTQKLICSANLTKENPSIDLARWLNGIPVIYYPAGLQAAAIRFKNSLQENAKMHAFAEDVIEACHNGIVSWERSSDVRPILIQGKDDYFKTKDLWKIVKEYFKLNKIAYKEINSIEGGILSKIINLIYLLDYASIYRAVMVKVDPTPVKSIDFIKNRLSKSY
jgi:glucose/mannose-6-phosphate isomerase